MQCNTVEEQLAALVQGELEPAMQRKVRAHLQDCPSCLDEKACIEAFFDLMSTVPPITVSAEFDDRLEAKLAALPRPRPIPARRFAEPRGMAFLSQYLRHRVQTAPILAASVLLHFLLLSFLTVLVVNRAGDGKGSGFAWQGIPGQNEIDEDRLELELPEIPEADSRPQMPEFREEDPDLPEPRREPLRDVAPAGRPGPSEVVPGWMLGRMKPLERLRDAGASDSIPVIAKGLRWLAGEQAADGSWASSPSDTSQTYRVGVTSLSLLSFLAAGHCEQRPGTYRGVVRRGLSFLRASQDARGLFGKASGNYLYNHIIALQALAENHAFGGATQTGDRARIDKGLRLLLSAQHPDGGWGYEARADRGTSDSSVTGWVVFVLGVLEKMQIEIPAQVTRKARGWFREVTDADGRVGYRRRGDAAASDHSLTCVALLSRQILDRTRAPDQRQVKRSLRTALANLQPKAERNYSLLYHTTFALQQAPGSFTRWEPKVRQALIQAQQRGGNWQASGLYGKHAGPVYTTAIALLTLQVHYRYEQP